MNAIPMPAAHHDATWRRLASVLAPHRRVIACLVVAVMAIAALEVIPPLVMRRIVDEHLAVGRAEGLLWLATLYLGASALAEGVGFLSDYLTALAAQGALYDLRVRLFAHLQKLPMRYFDQTPLGEIISRCTADVDTVDTLFSSGVARLVTDLVRLLSAIVAMVALSPLLSLVAILIVPVLVLITNAFRTRVREAERALRRTTGKANAYLQEILGLVEVIRIYGRESIMVRRFQLVLREMHQAFCRSNVFVALFLPTMNLLSALATALLLGVGVATLFSDWSVSVGTLTAFVLLFRRFFAPITALGDEWQTVQGALSGLERIFEVLNVPVEEAPTAALAVRSSSAEPILVQGVIFGYAPGHPVLHGLDLAVHYGEQVAIIGRTGAGKSSVLHLLGGLYQPWEGEVRVAHLNPYALSRDERRRVVGVVPQMVQLFSGTVRDNLTLFDATVPMAAVERAAQVSGADAFIRALPRGYDTWLGYGKKEMVQLSAGQRQLLALTRALVWDPPVLLLDEATALVDNASDAAFRAALRASAQDSPRAVLIVAHRLATAREADLVAVMDEGRIIESGPPDELMASGGRFAALLELESAGWDWRNDPGVWSRVRA